MRLRLAVAGLVAAGFAGEAFPAPSPQDLFKGRVREGLYEVKSEMDTTGLPASSRGQGRTSDSRQQCLTGQEIERGVSPGRDCEVKSFQDSRTAATLLMECKGGTATEMRFTFGKDSFSSEMRTTTRQDGKTYFSVLRSEARHIGPCIDNPQQRRK